MSDNPVMVYGCPPADVSPRLPEAAPFIVPPAAAPPWMPGGMSVPRVLIACVDCKRHIQAGTECPFCHADRVAKAPGRKAVEDAAVALAAAAQTLETAAAAVESSRELVAAARLALEKAGLT